MIQLYIVNFLYTLINGSKTGLTKEAKNHKLNEIWYENMSISGSNLYIKLIL